MNFILDILDNLDTKSFQNMEEMYEYLQSKVTSDSGVLKYDPPTLDGTYLEVLSAKVILPEDIKLVCHFYKPNPPSCHRLMPTSQSKLTYSMVRRPHDGTVFPAIFFSHKQKCNKNSCSWFTHISEAVLLDKSSIA